MSLRSNSTAGPRLLGPLLALILGACATQPPAVPPGLFETEVLSFSGSALSGPLPEAPHLNAAPWSVDVHIACFDELPADAGEPLAAYVGHVFVEPGGKPLKTQAALAAGVRLSEVGEALPESSWEQRHVGVLWPGSTVRWLTSSNPDAKHAPLPSWEAFGLWVSRPAQGSFELELSLTFEGLVAPTPNVDDEADADPAPVRQVERIVLSLPAGALERGLRLLLPAPRFERPLAVQLVELRVARAWDGSRPELAVAERVGREDIGRALTRAESGSLTLDSLAAFHLERARALDALDGGQLERPALLFLANITAAAPTGEAALAADDAAFAGLLSALREGLAQSEDPPEGAAEFGWFLERTTYRWLAHRALDPLAPLEPELQSLLLRNAGELGRYPDLLLETVALSSGQADVRERLARENRTFLEDSHPAARVRSYDWLSVRGLAPADFDPLGTREERRAALAAAEDAARTAAGEGAP